MHSSFSFQFGKEKAASHRSLARVTPCAEAHHAPQKMPQNATTTTEIGMVFTPSQRHLPWGAEQWTRLRARGDPLADAALEEIIELRRKGQATTIGGDDGDGLAAVRRAAALVRCAGWYHWMPAEPPPTHAPKSLLSYNKFIEKDFPEWAFCNRVNLFGENFL